MTLESQKLLWYFFLAMGKWVKYGKQYSLRHILAVNSTLCSACTGLIWGAKTALSACERWRAQLHCRVTVSNVMHSWKQTIPPVLEAHSARAQQSQQTFSWKKISQWNYLESWWLCIRLCCYDSGRSRISCGGGTNQVGGAPTPEAAMFWKICMSKWKNLDP